MLYEGGLITKRIHVYTSIRNSTNIVKESEKKKKNLVKTEFLAGCEVPNILP